MPKKHARKDDDREQYKAFRKAARELGCDDNEQRFQAALRTIAKAKPSPQHKQRRANRGGKDQNA
jgi:hypothetical protein